MGSTFQISDQRHGSELRFSISTHGLLTEPVFHSARAGSRSDALQIELVTSGDILGTAVPFPQCFCAATDEILDQCDAE